MKNNMPRYMLIDITQIDQVVPADDADVMRVSAKLIAQNHEAYKELAK